MMETPPSQSRNILARIFLSPDEVRLRAGWRLLLHTILFVLVSSVSLLILLNLELPIIGESIELDVPSRFVDLLNVLLATWIARRLLDRRSFTSLGLRLSRQSMMDVLAGITIAGAMMGAIFLIELALGWTTVDRWAWQVEPANRVLLNMSFGFLVFLFVGFSEEILSRGYHLQNLKDGLNLGWALVISSSIFALLHTANPNSSWLSALGILLAGLFLAYGWVRTGQLWLSIGLHIGWNFFEGNVFGFPVSGLNTYRLIHHSPIGPEIMTGGAFGPEAGLILLPGMALGILLIYRYTPNQRSAMTSSDTLDMA